MSAASMLRPSISDIPFSFRRDEIVETQLAIDLFQPQMYCIVVQVSL